MAESVATTTAPIANVETPAGGAPSTPPAAQAAAVEAPQTPIESAPAAAESKPAEAPKEAPKAEPTLLADPSRAAPPPKTPAQEAAEVATPAPAEAQPKHVDYTPFNAPEGMEIAPAKVKEFTELISQHAVPQEAAQKLVDLYYKEAADYERRVRAEQHKAWDDYVQGKRSEFVNDPELGGNRQDTTLGMAASMIEQYGGTAEQQAALRQELDYTGMGNSINMIRILKNISQKLGEPGAVSAPPPRQGPGDRKSRWYGGNSKQNGAAV